MRTAIEMSESPPSEVLPPASMAETAALVKVTDPPTKMNQRQRLCHVQRISSTESRVHTHAREEARNNFGNKEQKKACNNFGNKEEIVITGEEEEAVDKPGIWIVASMTG